MTLSFISLQRSMVLPKLIELYYIRKIFIFIFKEKCIVEQNKLPVRSQ